MFTLIFQLFLDSHVMSRASKTSTIIPVPKKATPLQLNGYCPVALTPIIAKCLEMVVSKHLKFEVVDQLDPFQFAYKASRGVEDASLTLLNLITQHSEKAKSYVRIIFVETEKVQSCCRKSSSPTRQKSTTKFPQNNNQKQGAGGVSLP